MDQRRIVAVVVALIVALAIGGGLYFLVLPDPYLAMTLAVMYGVGAGFSVEFPLVFRGGEGGPSSHLGGVFAGLVMFAAIFGPSPGLDLTQDQRFALGLLVIGTAFACVNLGVAMVYSAETDAGAEAIARD